MQPRHICNSVCSHTPVCMGIACLTASASCLNIWSSPTCRRDGHVSKPGCLNRVISRHVVSAHGRYHLQERIIRDCAVSQGCTSIDGQQLCQQQLCSILPALARYCKSSREHKVSLKLACVSVWQVSTISCLTVLHVLCYSILCQHPAPAVASCLLVISGKSFGQ